MRDAYYIPGFRVELIMNKGNKLIKGTGIYAVGTFGTKILSFLIVPLYTYYIATADMGVYDIIISTVSLLTPIVTLQISDAAYKWIISTENQDKEQYIRATLQVLIINSSVAVVLILLIDYFRPIPYCIYFCIVLILTQSLQSLQKILRALQRQWLFALSGIIYTIVLLSLNVVQLCFLNKGVESLFQSAIVANAVSLIIISVVERRFWINYIKKPDLKLIFEMYKYSCPLVPNYLNWWIMNSSDRYIILWTMGSPANGILAIAHKFPSMLHSVLQLFTNSWQDLSVADSDINISLFYTKVFRKFSRLSLSSLWVLIPLTKVFVFFIMSSSYKTACNFVSFYYLGTIFQSFSAFYGVGYLRSGKTKKAFSTSIYGAIINAAVNICFVRFIGLQAAAISTFVGFLVMWIIREKQNREDLQIKINWVEMIILTLMSVLFSVFSIMFGTLVNLVLFSVGLVGFIVFNFKDIKTFLCIIKRKVINRFLQ